SQPDVLQDVRLRPVRCGRRERLCGGAHAVDPPVEIHADEPRRELPEEELARKHQQQCDEKQWNDAEQKVRDEKPVANAPEQRLPEREAVHEKREYKEPDRRDAAGDGCDDVGDSDNDGECERDALKERCATKPRQHREMITARGRTSPSTPSAATFG